MPHLPWEHRGHIWLFQSLKFSLLTTQLPFGFKTNKKSQKKKSFQPQDKSVAVSVVSCSRRCSRRSERGESLTQVQQTHALEASASLAASSQASDWNFQNFNCLLSRDRNTRPKTGWLSEFLGPLLLTRKVWSPGLRGLPVLFGKPPSAVRAQPVTWTSEQQAACARKGRGTTTGWQVEWTPTQPPCYVLDVSPKISCGKLDPQAVTLGSGA